MNTTDIAKISEAELEEFLITHPSFIYQTASEIIYEGQIPLAGYLIVQGKVELFKNKRKVLELYSGHYFGVEALMNNIPFEYTVKIHPFSRVCILDKSTIKELLEIHSKRAAIPQFLKSLA